MLARHHRRWANIIPVPANIFVLAITNNRVLLKFKYYNTRDIILILRVVSL